MQNISASVGSRGRNRPNDVKIVQRLLNKWQDNIDLDNALLTDGLAGRKTVLAIVEFQGRVVGMIEPDGRVDPGGLTLRMLSERRSSFALLPRKGPGFYTYGVDEKRFGTRSTLASVMSAARSMEEIGKLVGVGNISLENGGRMRPHTSHQRGVDVDFRPLRSDGQRRPVDIEQAEYNAADTKKLVRALRRDSNLDLILFNDTTISGASFWSGHDNHLHVRFKK